MIKHYSLDFCASEKERPQLEEHALHLLKKLDERIPRNNLRIGQFLVGEGPFSPYSSQDIENALNLLGVECLYTAKYHIHREKQAATPAPLDAERKLLRELQDENYKLKKIIKHSKQSAAPEALQKDKIKEFRNEDKTRIVPESSGSSAESFS